MAEQLGKSREVVSNYANNNTQPSIKTLKAMAVILDVDIRELLVPTKS
ncbi:MAG: helix-turn-helix transcriptional regulator [Cytophagales bacterium]|nr:helix-turn-helix transcriptional regulator [Cytophagales bacterium]